MVEKDVGQHHRAQFKAMIKQSGGRQKLHHMAGETADRALFNGDQGAMLAGQTSDQVSV